MLPPELRSRSKKLQPKRANPNRLLGHLVDARPAQPAALRNRTPSCLLVLASGPRHAP